MPRNNKGRGVRRTEYRGFNPKYRPVRLTKHARSRLAEPEQSGFTEFEILQTVKQKRGSYFNECEIILTSSSGRKIAVIFVDSLESRNIVTIVGVDRMPVERKHAFAASM